MQSDVYEHLIKLGISPDGEPPVPMSEEDLVAVEDSVGGRLPDDYREFAAKYGATMLEQQVEFPIAEPMPIFKTGAARRFEAGPISHFYGSGTGPDSLLGNLETYRDRVPQSLMPIAYDGGGNQICLGIRGNEFGKVLYWDHHHEWDEDDYEEEQGTKMPPEMQFQNVYLVADSFEEFIRSLKLARGV